MGKTYIRTEKGTELVPAWIAKHIFKSMALYHLEQYIKMQVPPIKQERARAKANYFYRQFYIINQ